MGENRPEQDVSLGTLIKRLFDEGKDYAQAEIAYYRTIATSKLGHAKSGLLFGVIALVLFSAASIGLILGLLLILSALMGTGWATLVVVGTSLLLAVLFGWLAVRCFKSTFWGDA